MARNHVIVGAGPAAAAAVLATEPHSDVILTVLDVGGELEAAHQQATNRLEDARPDVWARSDIDQVVGLPVMSKVQGLPEKRSFGSDYPFRDFGQLRDVVAHGDVNNAIVSGAYGGFSNVWGAQVMPFSPATFRDWPFPFSAIEPHYRAVLEEIPFTAEDDDLAATFPLLTGAHPLPRLSQRTDAVLERAARHRARLHAAGVTLGRARLAMDASRCILCGLCLTGCPYHLVYAASQTLDRFRAAGRIKYRSGLLVTRVEEHGDEVVITARDIKRDTLETFRADRVYLACGGVGSTRIVLSSLNLFDRPVRFIESAQFMLPFISGHPTPDPRPEPRFTLNQFNMLIDRAHDGYDMAHLHFYTYNEAFNTALPTILRRQRFGPLRRLLLRHLSVALGYLPSWNSPTFRASASPPRSLGELAAISLEADPPRFLGNPALRSVMSVLMNAAPMTDLWPLLPALDLPARGKSYHWGGSFPHSGNDSQGPSTDLLGRVRPWERIHLIDASVFPSIAATTFTLTIMANAHRVVTATLTDAS